MEKYVKVPLRKYTQLQTDSNTLNALEQGGVDNWDWYGESISQWEEEYGPIEYEEKDITLEIIEE
jgi:hypothetical protein